MIQSGVYNYVNVLDRAADAAWIRNDVISNNIANVDTPGYKRKDVQFETFLAAQVSGGNLDEQIADIDLSTLNSMTYTDSSQYSYRLDGNNVDINTESAELAKNQLRYYTLMNSMTQEFSRIRTVLQKPS